LQPKLLRVLQIRNSSGGEFNVESGFSLIAATNRNWWIKCREGVRTICLPAERVSDSSAVPCGARRHPCWCNICAEIRAVMNKPITSIPESHDACRLGVAGNIRDWKFHRAIGDFDAWLVL